MITISIKHDMTNITRYLDDIQRKQVPYATARALTKTVQGAKDEAGKQIAQRLNRPTRYATSAMYIKPATKAKLEAMVYVKDAGMTQKSGMKSQADVLGHLFAGGKRKHKNFEGALLRRGYMSRGEIAVPGAACPLDGYGNIPAAFIVKLLAYFQSFGESGYKANMTAKGRARMEKAAAKGAAGAGVQYFISRGPGHWFGRGSWKNGRSQKLPRGIWQRQTWSAGSSIKPVIMFVNEGAYKRYFDLPAIASSAINANFSNEFDSALSEAMRTAR